MNLENDLGRDNIKRLVLRLAIPSLLAQFVNILYSIVDRMYVGNIADIGEVALAALGVSTPIMTLIGSFSALVGIGAATLMSIKLGEDNKKSAKKILSNALLMLIILSIFLTIGSLLFQKQILYRFGASDITYPYAKDYFSIYVLGTLFAIVGTGLNHFIMSQGYSQVAMKSVIIGAVTNIILDPIFIFALKMNVPGAAIATVIAQIASCLYSLRFLLRKDIPIGISVGGYSFSVAKQILTVGLTPFIIVATDNIILIAVNMVLRKYGGVSADMLMACFTILQSFMAMVNMPLIGITSGTQPILGYNYGARQSGRVKEAQMYTFFLGLAFTILMTILAQTIPHLFTRIFTSNPEYIAVTAKAIRMYTLGLLPMTIQYTVVDGFTGIGAVRVAVVFSLWRKSIFLLYVMIVPRFLPIMYLFFAEPISDLIGGISCALAYYFIMRRLVFERGNSGASV